MNGQDIEIELPVAAKVEQTCYICGRLIHLKRPFEAVLEDDDFGHVFVGRDCFAKLVKAGYDGVRGQKGHGPMVFCSTAMAEAWVRGKPDRENAEVVAELERTSHWI